MRPRKILVVGAGRNLDDLLGTVERDCNIVAIADSDESKHGKIKNRIKIIPMSSILDYEFDECLVSVSYPRFELLQTLLDIGVQKNSIRFFIASNEPVKNIGITENNTLAISLKESTVIIYCQSQTDEMEIRRLFRYRNLNSPGCYLHDVGWFKSVENNKPIDLLGNSIPWIAYPALEFIQARIKPGINIFEYGSGHSTIYWAKKGANVVSVEHDKLWYEKVKREMSAYENAKAYYHELVYGGGYSKFASAYKKNFFDIIVIDGRDRVNCCKAALEALNDYGVILFDDSYRDRYEEGYSYLRDHGFKEIDFWGMTSSIAMKHKTSIFYRSRNCLQI